MYKTHAFLLRRPGRAFKNDIAIAIAIKSVL